MQSHTITVQDSDQGVVRFKVEKVGEINVLDIKRDHYHGETIVATNPTRTEVVRLVTALLDLL